MDRERQKYWADLLDDLLNLEGGLSDREVEFIETLEPLRGFTEKQGDRIEEIWNTRIPESYTSSSSGISHAL